MKQVETIAETCNYHCSEKYNEDILILGSSYAKRSFVPAVIEENSGYTCYNSGEAGNGIICAWVRYLMVSRKKQPRLVIYTLTPEYDYLLTDPYEKYLDAIKPYGPTGIVEELYNNLGLEKELLQLYSSFVRYNSQFLSLIARSIDKRLQTNKGYDPLFATYKPSGLNPNKDKIDRPIDEKKASYVEWLFSELSSQHIPILCIYTPRYYGHDDIVYDREWGNILCKKYNIMIIDDTELVSFVGKDELFNDAGHLNNEGARLYSKIVADRIKNMCE